MSLVDVDVHGNARYAFERVEDVLIFRVTEPKRGHVFDLCISGVADRRAPSLVRSALAWAERVARFPPAMIARLCEQNHVLVCDRDRGVWAIMFAVED